MLIQLGKVLTLAQVEKELLVDQEKIGKEEEDSE